jgi:hypothetical protein
MFECIFSITWAGLLYCTVYVDGKKGTCDQERGHMARQGQEILANEDRSRKTETINLTNKNSYRTEPSS